ncbi:hypothetical protein [Thermosporothrix hazakensis]|uniref:hypothetical protein n=1 Tax=Thermosporothrix hazakensis TaxID=644383 RepID=UPI001473E314|nr:hypothetical protein [Thermosporothrix hazakensis]
MITHSPVSEGVPALQALWWHEEGTASAQTHLRLILSRFGVTVLEQPEVSIAKS